MKIPKKFTHGNGAKANTVGALIKQLELLPKSLKVKQGFGNNAILVVYNSSTENPHLEIIEED